MTQTQTQHAPDPAHDREALADLGRRWAAAEVAGDTDVLAGLVLDDFRLVGPAGFVLERAQWLGRYAPDGGLATLELDWRDVDVRVWGDAAVAIGIHAQRATYRGGPADGRFRGTHTYLRRDGEWRLAAIHLGPVMEP